MHGKKYKAKDKTVKKSGRDGLSEINLHSHETVSISSREGEFAVRRVPEPVNYQKNRRAVPDKKRRSRRAAVTGKESGEGRSADGGGFKKTIMSGGRHDNFKQPEMPGNGFFQASGTDSSIRSGVKIESRWTEIVPGADGKQAEAAEVPDGVRQDSRESPAGMVAWSQDRSGGCREDEKAAYVREEAPESGMDTQAVDGRLYCERRRVSMRPGRGGSIQQAFLRPAGMEKGRKQKDRKWQRRNKRLYQKDRMDIVPEESCASVDKKEETSAGSSSAAVDMHACGGAPYRQDMDSGNRAADDSRPAGHGDKTLQVKKPRLFFSVNEKTDMETPGNGTFKDIGSRKQKGAKETAPPDGAEKGSRKYGRLETDGNKKGVRLIFGEKDSGMVRGAGMGIVKKASRPVFRAVDESGSVGTDAVDESETGTERLYTGQKAGAAASGLRHIMRRCSSRTAKCRQRLDEGSQGLQHEKAEKSSGPESVRQPDMYGMPGKNGKSMAKEKKKSTCRMQQKKRYKRAYQLEACTGIRKTGRHAAEAVQAGASRNALHAAGRKRHTVVAFFGRKDSMQWILIAVFLLFLAGISMLASCTALLQGTSGIAGTAYPGSDEDIRRTEARYLELENELDRQVNGMEAAHPGYDEYRYQIDEISHGPYQLASYLTVVCPGYTYAQAEGMLQEILEGQYRLTVEERTETRADPDTGEIMEWHVLCISLTNRGLDAVAHDWLTEDQEKLYQAYNLTHGCRDGLFGETEENSGLDDSAAAVPDGALSDRRFANMLQEAEKYIGYPYVWGGSSPQTSFDCSGFVSWVVNNCGNGWNVGRQTAEGLRRCCSYVAPEDAEPGDLIFFQGTYNTPGASHVGIYIGNNRMIHCGSPIQITELGNYWQLHFLSYGRLP